MLEVDGGEGGGQLVRSALALSMLDGEAVEITDVRGTRPTPGLKPQHLTAVSAAAEVCDAAVEGADGGSETIRFKPAAPSGGRYEADIGTAGSLTLLFDTFLPLATQIDEPLTITATGGTDVKWSPPIAYYRTVKLPLLRRLGIAAAVECEKTGFYPAGGGRATLRLWPSTLSPIELTERGRPTTARVYSKASTDLADGDVVERQADTATDALAGLGIEVVHHRTTYAATESSGSVVTVRVDAGGSPVGFGLRRPREVRRGRGSGDHGRDPPVARVRRGRRRSPRRPVAGLSRPRGRRDHDPARHRPRVIESRPARRLRAGSDRRRVRSDACARR
ncbi:RNA 3'-terminal phosphate cyclase [Halosimplex aquaticum]